VAQEPFGGVVAQQVLADEGEGFVVVAGTRVDGGVDEAAGERLEGQFGGKGEAGVEGGELGGAQCFLMRGEV
jgi:hypothetical protein